MRVAVVGLGAWGSMTAWRLAAAGADVVGFEAGAIGHDRGSSHGGTRLYRRLCVEHAGLVPLAERSAALWRELERDSGEPLLTVTGGVSIGPADSALVRDSLAVAAATGVDHALLDAAALRARWPMVRVDDGAVGVVDPAAGILAAEPSVLAAAAAARRAGAELREDVRVDVADAGDGVVRVDGRDERFDQVVVTAGAWTGELVPGSASRRPAPSSRGSPRGRAPRRSTRPSGSASSSWPSATRGCGATERCRAGS